MALLINRVRVYSGEKIVYDESLAPGLNVIEGENSSGKSTVMKLIYHGIGGSILNSQWTDHALRCSRVFVECEVNGVTLTLARPVATGQQPIIVTSTGLEQAITSVPIEQWLEFGYSRTEGRHSFSQFMFSTLGMPDAYSDEGDFITFHQLLRAHYADQESNNHTVLKEDGSFDKSLTREAIGNFLLGAVDHRLAGKEAEFRAIDLRHARANAALMSGLQLLGGEFDELNIPANEQRQQAVRAEVEALNLEVRGLANDVIRPITESDLGSERSGILALALAGTRQKVAALQAAAADLKFQTSDSAVFISTLKHRAVSLTEAGAIAADLGPITLDFCPACGSSVSQPESAHHCYLCKSVVDTADPTLRFANMLHATQAQIEQSERLQKARARKIAQAEAALDEARRELSQISAELASLQTAVVTGTQESLNKAQTRLGFLASELERLQRDRLIIERVQNFREEKEGLAAELARLRGEIDELRTSSTARVASALSAVSLETRTLLRSDLPRQEEFMHGEQVTINYRDNLFSIDGVSAFSASSQAYFRNAAYIAALIASKRVRTMRHLGLVILENLEDKGTHPDRYHNFHRVICESLNRLAQPWQAIVATADWNPELETGFSRIGRYYTHEKKTLEF